MAEDDEKPIVSKYSLMNTKQLLDKWHELTHFEVDLDQLLADEVEGTFDKVENDYFIQKRKEHAKHKGKPKSKKLKKGKERHEAQELVNKHALEAIKKELGDEVAKAYADNPHKISDYLDGKLRRYGFGYEELIKNLAESGKAVNQSEMYKRMKQTLAEHSTEEIAEKTAVESELSRRYMSDTDEMNDIQDHFTDYTKGHKLKKHATIEQLLGALQEFKKEGHDQFSEKYLKENYHLFKGGKEEKE